MGRRRQRDEPAERISLVPDDRGGTTVVVDGQPQSHVHLADPRLLTFEYVAQLAMLLDTLPPGPLAVTHVGGAGMTLARYVAATRPGSPQVVLEPDAELTERVRQDLPLPRGHRIRVRPVDGRTGVAALGDASADVVVVDAYAGGRVPAELTTAEFLADVARVLRPDGVALLNIADEPGMHFVARVAATLESVAAYADLALVATNDVLKGRRFGNVVVAAARGGLDEAALVRGVARADFPTGARRHPQVLRLAAGARALTDADPARSPTPPDPGRWRTV